MNSQYITPKPRSNNFVSTQPYSTPPPIHIFTKPSILSPPISLLKNELSKRGIGYQVHESPRDLINIVNQVNNSKAFIVIQTSRESAKDLSFVFPQIYSFPKTGNNIKIVAYPSALSNTGYNQAKNQLQVMQLYDKFYSSSSTRIKLRKIQTSKDINHQFLSSQKLKSPSKPSSKQVNFQKLLINDSTTNQSNQYKILLQSLKEIDTTRIFKFLDLKESVKKLTNSKHKVLLLTDQQSYIKLKNYTTKQTIHTKVHFIVFGTLDKPNKSLVNDNMYFASDNASLIINQLGKIGFSNTNKCMQLYQSLSGNKSNHFIKQQTQNRSLQQTFPTPIINQTSNPTTMTSSINPLNVLTVGGSSSTNIKPDLIRISQRGGASIFSNQSSNQQRFLRNWIVDKNQNQQYQMYQENRQSLQTKPPMSVRASRITNKLSSQSDASSHRLKNSHYNDNQLKILKPKDLVMTKSGQHTQSLTQKQTQLFKTPINKTQQRLSLQNLTQKQSKQVLVPIANQSTKKVFTIAKKTGQSINENVSGGIQSGQQISSKYMTSNVIHQMSEEYRGSNRESLVNMDDHVFLVNPNGNSNQYVGSSISQQSNMTAPGFGMNKSKSNDVKESIATLNPNYTKGNSTFVINSNNSQTNNIQQPVFNGKSSGHIEKQFKVQQLNYPPNQKNNATVPSINETHGYNGKQKLSPNILVKKYTINGYTGELDEQSAARLKLEQISLLLSPSHSKIVTIIQSKQKIPQPTSTIRQSHYIQPQVVKMPQTSLTIPSSTNIQTNGSNKPPDIKKKVILNSLEYIDNHIQSASSLGYSDHKPVYQYRQSSPKKEQDHVNYEVKPNIAKHVVKQTPIKQATYIQNHYISQPQIIQKQAPPAIHVHETFSGQGKKFTENAQSSVKQPSQPTHRTSNYLGIADQTRPSSTSIQAQIVHYQSSSQSRPSYYQNHQNNQNYQSYQSYQPIHTIYQPSKRQYQSGTNNYVRNQVVGLSKEDQDPFHQNQSNIGKSRTKKGSYLQRKNDGKKDPFSTYEANHISQSRVQPKYNYITQTRYNDRPQTQVRVSTINKTDYLSLNSNHQSLNVKTYTSQEYQKVLEERQRSNPNFALNKQQKQFKQGRDSRTSPVHTITSNNYQRNMITSPVREIKVQPNNYNGIDLNKYQKTVNQNGLTVYKTRTSAIKSSQPNDSYSYKTTRYEPSGRQYANSPTRRQGSSYEKGITIENPLRRPSNQQYYQTQRFTNVRPLKDQKVAPLIYNQRSPLKISEYNTEQRIYTYNSPNKHVVENRVIKQPVVQASNLFNSIEQGQLANHSSLQNHESSIINRNKLTVQSSSMGLTSAIGKKISDQSVQVSDSELKQVTRLNNIKFGIKQRNSLPEKQQFFLQQLTSKIKSRLSIISPFVGSSKTIQLTLDSEQIQRQTQKYRYVETKCNSFCFLVDQQLKHANSWIQRNCSNKHSKVISYRGMQGLYDNTHKNHKLHSFDFGFILTNNQNVKRANIRTLPQNFIVVELGIQGINGLQINQQKKLIRLSQLRQLKLCQKILLKPLLTQIILCHKPSSQKSSLNSILQLFPEQKFVKQTLPQNISSEFFQNLIQDQYNQFNRFYVICQVGNVKKLLDNINLLKDSYSWRDNINVIVLMDNTHENDNKLQAQNKYTKLTYVYNPNQYKNYNSILQLTLPLQSVKTSSSQPKQVIYYHLRHKSLPLFLQKQFPLRFSYQQFNSLTQLQKKLVNIKQDQNQVNQQNFRNYLVLHPTLAEQYVPEEYFQRIFMLGMCNTTRRNVLRVDSLNIIVQLLKK